MGLFDFFGGLLGNPTPSGASPGAAPQQSGMIGLLSPDDRFMAAMQALSHMGAQMAQPGQSKGQALASGFGGLGAGLQSGMQNALMQNIMLGKVRNEADQRKAQQDYINSLPPDQQPLARAAPGEYLKSAMPKRGETPFGATVGPDGTIRMAPGMGDYLAQRTGAEAGGRVTAERRAQNAVPLTTESPEFRGRVAGAEAGARAPVEAWLKWQGPQQQQPGANILDLSSVGPGRPGAVPGGAQSPPTLTGAPGAGPRMVVKAPVEWATDPANPGLQVSSITGERRAIPPGVTDDKEGAKSAIISTDRAIQTAEELLKHPGRQAATGKSFLLGYVPGTDAYDFGAKLETLKSQLFLPEVEKMKGMGALSNAEGQKLTAAVQALDPKMTEEGLYKGIQDVVSQLRVGRERMMTKTQTGYLPQPSALPGNAADLTKLSDDEVLKRLGIR